MGLSVQDRGRAIATFRHIHVEMMEMLAQWTPTTPEMEVKLMLGEHVWDIAQSADALGKRTRELRMPIHHGLKPADPYVELLANLRTEADTARRIEGFYDVLLPGLASRYRAYLQQTDSLMDAPTVRILDQILQVQSRMIEQSRALRAELPVLGQADKGWVDALSRRESQISPLVA